MVTGSWDMSVRLWDPRTPCNAGTFTQPEKVQSTVLVVIFPLKIHYAEFNNSSVMNVIMINNSFSPVWSHFMFC